MAGTAASKKGRPFSVRFSSSTELFVEREAKRLSRSKSAVVEAFTEETARTRRFPGVAFRGDDVRRRAWVVGSGLDIWEINQMAEDFGSLEALLDGSELDERQVRLALAYRAEFAAEIDDLIAENRRPAAELEVLFPFIEHAAPLSEQ